MIFFAEGKAVQDSSMKYRLLLTAGSIGCAAAVFAGIALAAIDSRLTEANDAVVRAVGLLKAAETPGGASDFRGHRTKAISLLTRAQAEIGKAIEAGVEEPAKP
jgi:hypothetical protein